MGCFRMCCAVVAVLSCFVLLAFGEARVLSGGGGGGVGGGGDPPSSSSAVKEHGKMATSHVDGKLQANITAAAAGAAAKDAAAVEDRGMAAAPAGECSAEAVVVSQDKEGPMPNGIPSYSVTITNTCLGCTVRDVHVACGEFASTELVSPSDFRRLAVGDCLVRDGGALGPGDAVAFEYSNSFQYDLDVASVSCG